MDVELWDFNNFTFGQDIKLAIIVVYDSPIDYNNKFVARLFDIDVPTPYIIVKDSFQEIIDAMPKNFIFFDRFKLNDPVISCVFIEGAGVTFS